MKVALIHDYLNQWGGGERVLAALADMFPDAPIYTLLHDADATGGRFAHREVRTGILDSAFIRKHHRWFIPLMPLAAGVTKIENCDLVISSSAGFAKGVAVPKGAKHLAYIHSPLRYAWDKTYIADELRHVKPLSWLRPPFLAPAVSPIVSYLRAWDKRAAQKPDVLLANSSFIAGQVRRYYGREARVLYPPVALSAG
ncbi:MAG: glycosyltransferase [Candidatus Harrisonbacteria bacterium]|nr:glycosyltransferase [Candidatus Harrisonbacteria bacterium]